jgi:hypothetical protein
MSPKSGGRTVPYDLVKEQWNEYVFSDQTIVRVRLILTNVFQEFELGPYRVLTQKMTLVSAPNYPQGSPGIHRQGVCQDGCVRWKTTPLLRDERWNEYNLSDDSQVLRILFKEEESYKIMDEYDDTGQPVYVVEGRTLLSIKSTETQVENN